MIYYIIIWIPFSAEKSLIKYKNIKNYAQQINTILLNTLTLPKHSQFHPSFARLLILIHYANVPIQLIFLINLQHMTNAKIIKMGQIFYFYGGKISVTRFKNLNFQKKNMFLVY